VRLSLLATAGLLAIGSLSAQNAVRDTAVCYHLTYPASADGASSGYAEYVAVDTAGDSVVRSGVGPGKSLEFWQMFLSGATWERHADTLLLHFSNGASGVLYKLTPAMGTSMRGRVWFLYDVINQQPPPFNVRARAVPCRSAVLQSLPYTLAESNAIKYERRLRQLREIEAERVRALVPSLAGTYEFTLRIDSAARVTMYGRTELHAAEPTWSRSDPFVAPHDTIPPVHAYGYCCVPQLDETVWEG
jgi:hypothetical protein